MRWVLDRRVEIYHSDVYMKIRGLMEEKGLMEEDWNDRDNWRKNII